MPQTEEEHLENESMEDDRSTKDPNDAEVSCRFQTLPDPELTLILLGRFSYTHEYIQFLIHCAI